MTKRTGLPNDKRGVFANPQLSQTHLAEYIYHAHIANRPNRPAALGPLNGSEQDNDDAE